MHHCGQTTSTIYPLVLLASPRSAIAGMLIAVRPGLMSGTYPVPAAFLGGVEGVIYFLNYLLSRGGMARE